MKGIQRIELRRLAGNFPRVATQGYDHNCDGGQCNDRPGNGDPGGGSRNLDPTQCFGMECAIGWDAHVEGRSAARPPTEFQPD
jgi:hypothetical protein